MKIVSLLDTHRACFLTRLKYKSMTHKGEKLLDISLTKWVVIGKCEFQIAVKKYT